MSSLYYFCFTWYYTLLYVLLPGVNIAQPGQLLYIVSPDKTVVEDDNSQPVWVVPGTRLLAGDKDGYANVGQGQGELHYKNFPC